MSKRKYEILTEEEHQLVFDGKRRLHRIRALRDITDDVTGKVMVKKGELGGYIQHEGNLSQDESSWISGEAKAYGNARVSGSARLEDHAILLGNARLYGDARACEHACIMENVNVRGHVVVKGNAVIFGHRVDLFGDEVIGGNSRVHDYNVLSGKPSLQEMLRKEQKSKRKTT